MGNDFLRYISTRGYQQKLKFHDVIFEGLAPDGGLYIPESWPIFKQSTISSFSDKSYLDIAYNVISPFLDNTVNENDLREIIKSAYKNFNAKEITPLTKISENEYLLELFHGPTYAFKDIAMQFIAQLMNYYLSKDNSTINILGATSGDTGAAAIESFANIKSANIFILHPYKKITEIQRKFMTTVSSENVFNIAIEGNFDDCQQIVKGIFADNKLKKEKNLTAVNSINWARIMCQIVYYFYSVSQLPRDKEIVFAVPTGNFGDIFAGFISSKMGLKIDKLIIATNENDILTRTLNNGQHKLKEVIATSSPSIDIQISSNFERLIYDITKNPNYIKKIMKELNETGSYTLNSEVLSKIKKSFQAYSVTQDEVKSTISELYNEKNILIDPHTAVGLAASRKSKCDNQIHIILSTAHPAKFKETVCSVTNNEEFIPTKIKGLLELDEKLVVLKNDEESVKNFILENI